MNSAKAYLQEIWHLDTLIAAKISQRKTLWELATSVGGGFGDGSSHSGGSNDRMGKIMAKYVDLDREIADTMEKLYTRQNEAIAIFARIDERTYVKLLTKRYIEYKSWQEIADDMGYNSVRGIVKAHGKALQAFEKVLNNAENSAASGQ